MEIFVIAILVLVLFGAKKIPTFARSLGQGMKEFKKARDDFETELHKAQQDIETPKITPPQEKRQPVANVDV
jgi:sec-independent protein translocase protein TatA